MAQTHTWVGGDSPYTNDWADAGNWNGGVPTNGHDVVINDLTKAPNVQMGILGTTVTATIGTLTIAGVNASEGNLYIQNGSKLTTEAVLVGAAGGNSATTGDGFLGVVHAGSQLTINGALFVGDGTGAMQVWGGAAAAVNGQWTVIGRYGTGSLTIATRGTMTSAGDARIGEFAGSTGAVIVTGAGSSWTVKGPMYVGKAGTGSLTVSDKATVSTGDLAVGSENGGSGTILVESGGTLNSNTTVATIGNVDGSTGVATVTGAGSSWTLSNDLRVGNFGNGTLNVENKGAVTVKNDVIVAAEAGSRGGVEIDGGSLTASNVLIGGANDASGSIVVRNGGKLTTTGGTSIIGGMAAGATTTAGGAVLVDGKGSQWTAARDLLVGYYATGALMVANQGAVSAGGYIAVGDAGAGTGTLDVFSGGTLTTGAGYVGNLTGTTGNVTVDGNGSKWTVGQLLRVGRFGEAVVSIQNGGTITAKGGTIVAAETGSTGQLNVSTKGVLETTALTRGTGDAQVNFNGGVLRALASNANFVSGFTGTELTIAAGGLTVDSQAFQVTATSPFSGPGGLTKIGTGKLTLTAANTYAGATNIDAGELQLDGSLAAASAVAVKANATLSGIGRVGGSVANSGIVAPGQGGASGALTVNGAYVGNGGLLAIRSVLGNDASPTSRLVLNGAGASASGSTSVMVTNLGGAGAQTTGLGIPVVVAQNGGTTTGGAFSLSGIVAAGPYEYLLFRGGANASGDQAQGWYLRSSDTRVVVAGESETPLYRPEAAVYAAAAGAARQLGMTLLGTFHERAGDQSLLQGAGPVPGAWGRWIGVKSEMAQGGTLAPEIDGTTTGLQTGLDLYGLDHRDGSKDRFGVFFAYGRTLGDVSGFALGQKGYKAGKLDLSGYSIGATWTHVGASGWYVDTVLMGTKYDGDSKSNRGIGADIEGYGVTASVEGGYRFALGRGLTLEPQAQIVWQHLQLDGTADRFSSVRYDTPDSVSGRLGLRLAGSFQAGSMVLKPYVTANLWQDFVGSDRTIFSGTALTSGGKNSTAVELSGGVAAQLTKAVGLYGDVSYLTDVAGPDRQAWRGNVGLRVTW